MQKKFLLPSFTLITSLLHAECCDDPCRPPVESCVDCAQLWPSKGPNWIVTPNAGPCVRDGADIFVTGEFLYWTVREDHLGFALRSGLSSTSTGTATTIHRGTILHPNWKFSPGFKVGLGMLFDHDGWDIYANYTWLRPRDIEKEVTISSDEGASDLLIDYLWGVGVNFVGTAYHTAKTHWNLNFNVIDLELGRNFFVSRYLQMRPYFGLKGTWQEQENHLLFDASLSETRMIRMCENRMRNWGVGILAGLDTAWHFTKSFSFVAEVAASALWEGFEVHRRDVDIQLFPISFPFFKNNFHTIKPVLEFYLGLRWEMWYCCENYHLSLEAGWEEQHWSDQNQFAQFAVESRQGDLCLQGFTLKARFDF